MAGTGFDVGKIDPPVKGRPRALKSKSSQQDGPAARQEWLFALTLLLPAAVGITATMYPWASPLTLLHDPFRISETHTPLHPLMGALSNFGVIMLFSSASIALFSATLASDRAGRSFLIYAGLFSSLLATDDLFGLHDRVFFELFVGELAPGEIERNVKLAYLAAQVVYLVAFYKVIRRLNYLLLAGSLLLFFISNALDTRFVAVLVAILGSPLSESAQQAWEDLPKLAGTVFWLWFHMLAARKIVSEGWSQRLLPPGQQGRSG